MIAGYPCETNKLKYCETRSLPSENLQIFYLLVFVYIASDYTQQVTGHKLHDDGNLL